MNAGFCEAFEVARYASCIVKGAIAPCAMQVYEEELRAESRALFSANVEVTSTHDASRALAANASRLLPWMPAAGADLELLLDQLGLALVPSRAAPEPSRVV